MDTFPARVVGPGRKKLMWPIKSELKSKRIKHDAPIDPISWAYMKELRENNKTKKIYPVNPYVEVYQFRDSLYGWFTHNLDGGGDVWMFLVVGPERALLIDTAYGLGDLPGLAAEITGGKPLLVANTHEHFDHAYGNCRFEKVYCHEYLVPYLETQNEHIWDYLFDEYGDNIWVEFDRNDLPRFKKYEIAGVRGRLQVRPGRRSRGRAHVPGRPLGRTRGLHRQEEPHRVHRRQRHLRHLRLRFGERDPAGAAQREHRP